MHIYVYINMIAQTALAIEGSYLACNRVGSEILHVPVAANLPRLALTCLAQLPIAWNPGFLVATYLPRLAYADFPSPPAYLPRLAETSLAQLPTA